MSKVIVSDLPDTDPRKIFFRLEDDILSVADYVNIIIAVTDLSGGDETFQALNRLAYQIKDHADAVRDGFRKAFSA